MSVFFRRRNMPSLSISVTITGSGNSGYCYAIINGTKQYREGTHEVNAGDTITFGVYGTIRNPGYVEIDGENVLIARGLQTYDWTVPSGISAIEIAMEYSDIGRITVTTS